MPRKSRNSPNELSHVGADGAARVKRKGGREPQFSVSEVFEAALEMIDAEGLQNFSMRRLASKMDVGPMTVYGYVRSKEEILDGIVGLALHGVLDDLDRDAPWDKQMLIAVRDLHNALRSHPGVLELLLAKPAPSPQLDLIRETLLGVLSDAGFQRRFAWEAVGMLASYAIGFAASQASFGDVAAYSGHVERLRSLSPRDYPHLTALAEDYPMHMSDEAFENGLNYLIAGLKSVLSQS